MILTFFENDALTLNTSTPYRPTLWWTKLEQDDFSEFLILTPGGADVKGYEYMNRGSDFPEVYNWSPKTGFYKVSMSKGIHPKDYRKNNDTPKYAMIDYY